VQLTIQVALLLNPWKVRPPEFLQVYQVRSFDVVSDVRDRGTTEKRLAIPDSTRCDVIVDAPLRSAVVANEKLVEIHFLHFLQTRVGAQLR